MKLLLIFPMGKGRVMGKHSYFKLAPLSLPYIAGLTPGDVDIQIIDELVDEVDFDANVDLVGLSVLTPLAPRAYEVADRFRKRGIKVSSIVIAASASALSRKRQHDRLLELGGANLLLGVLLEDTFLLGHEFLFCTL